MAPLEKAIALKADGDEALVLLANCHLDRGNATEGARRRATGGRANAAERRSLPGRSAPCSSSTSTTPRRAPPTRHYLKLAPKGQYAGEIRSILSTLK